MDFDTLYPMKPDFPRRWPEWEAGPLLSAADIPDDARRAILNREGTSHRGIAGKTALRALEAGGVNDRFLEEIAALTELRFLYLAYPVTATSLAPLLKLRRLRSLALTAVRKADDFARLLELPELEILWISEAKHLTSLDFLKDAHHLRIIGVEGGLWKMQTLPGLAPLAGLRGLEELHLASVRLEDTDLLPLAACPKLKSLHCARFAPKKAFDALKAARPDMACTWFDQYDLE